MSALEAEWVGTPALRVQVREAMARELMLRVMLHDLRGSLTAVKGWVELLGMNDTPVPGGLIRSVEGFQDVVERYSDVDWPGRARAGQPAVLGLVNRTLGTPTEGPDVPGPLDSLRLIAALELVEPARLELMTEQSDGSACVSYRVHGLRPEAMTMGLTPHFDDLKTRLQAPDDVLGTCLLRVVARGGGGVVRTRSPGTFDLVCRV